MVLVFSFWFIVTWSSSVSPPPQKNQLKWVCLLIFATCRRAARLLSPFFSSDAGGGTSSHFVIHQMETSHYSRFSRLSLLNLAQLSNPAKSYHFSSLQGFLPIFNETLTERWIKALPARALGAEERRMETERKTGTLWYRLTPPAPPQYLSIKTRLRIQTRHNEVTFLIGFDVFSN